MILIVPKLQSTKNQTTTKSKVKKITLRGYFFYPRIIFSFQGYSLFVIDILFIFLTKNLSIIILIYPLDRKTLKLNLSLILTQNPTSPHNR